MIQIIGAGAIGCLWLAKLQQSGSVCHLVCRSKTTKSILQFTNLSGQQSLLTISVSQKVLNTSTEQKNSTILVCVKAQHVVSALLAQQQYIDIKQKLILMHNGYGCAEQVRKHFPDNPIICATTANASLVNAPLDVMHTGMGPTYLGAFIDSAEMEELTEEDKESPTQLHHFLKPVIEPLQQAMPEVYWSEDIVKKCWLKLVINAVINPLTAIHQIQNGQLQSPEYAVVIQPLISEIFAIAEAEHIDFELLALQQNIDQVILATAKNFSSMNRDIFYHRPTEIEFINGYLIKKAQQHNIEVPLLLELYNKVKVLENHSAIAEGKY
ncbi:2-dehydropantoate 2-reductase [Psychromonas sp. SA13A]|uniref:ketopantoate reductase family protein n=1 Tax=Psychromonas sp. SA13A TaxID=2686346 RepID=UPI001409D5A2|nr:2-dehydropantoate 2-reductase [Psychromonas sp. SA13A]